MGEHRVPFNPKIGRIATDANNFAVDRAFLAHYHVDGVDLAAASTVNILPFTKLAVAAQTGVIPANLVPDCPRNVQIDGNNSGQNNIVKVYGLNMAGEAITEEITLNATTAKAGVQAFASLTKIDLPAWDNDGAKHKSTVLVTTSTTAGTSKLEFTSAATGAPYEIECTFSEAQAASVTAAGARIAAVLNLDATFAAYYTATAADGTVTIERKINENTDSTVDLTVTDNGDGDLVLAAINAAAQAGVCDEVSVGWGQSVGIPYKLYADEQVIVKLFNKTVDAGTVTPDATYLEKNILALTGTPDGASDVDLYILV